MPLAYTRPSTELSLELDEVAAKARALRKCLDTPSNIPLDGFPAERLSELCGALAILPEGTAEGCRAPLSYARIELPRIRRSHIGRAAEAPAAEAPPVIARDDRLDSLLKDLIASVSTALAQYQADASVELPEALEPEPAVDATRLEATRDALKRADQVEAAVATARAPVEELRRADFPHAEDLGRQLSDMRATEGAARAELKSKEAQASQLEKLGAATERLADVIDWTGALLEKAPEFADAATKLSQPTRDWLRNTRRDALAFVVSKVQGLGSALRETAKVMRGLSARKPAERPADFDIDKVREMILASRAPPAAWRPWIEALDFGGDSLAALAALAGLTALRWLDLRETQVSDVDPLAGLTAVQQLYLSETQVSDVGALAGLTALQRLDLRGTQVSDVRALAGLTALQQLYLRETPVSDVGPLAGLTALQRLDLRGTQVSDVGALAGLMALQELDLSGTQVSDVDPLAGLTALQWLDLRETQVSDVGPLAGLMALQELDLSGTQVSDVRALAGLMALQELDLSGTQVSDVRALAGLTALQALDLRGTQVSDVGPLAGLTALQYLYLSKTQVSDVRALAGLTALQSLDLSGTPVSDVDPLAGLTALQWLDLRETQVSDVGALTGAANGLMVYVESKARRERLAATAKSSHVTIRIFRP